MALVVLVGPYFRVGKSLFNPHLLYLVYFTPQTMKPSVLLPELSKIVYFTPGWFFDSDFATVDAGCYSNGGFEFPFFILFPVNF